MIRVQIPATTANLGPGFDCLAMALELYNIVEFIQVSHTNLIIEVSGEGATSIPCGEDNLVYQAAQQVFKQVGFQPTGLKIRLVNQIPPARGLGSSTAAILGGAMAANLLAGGPLSQKEIISLASALEGHPDNVAAAALGGIVLSVQSEGELINVKIEPPPELRCVIAIPDFTLGTEISRDALPTQVSFQDAVFNLGRVALLVAALQRNDIQLLGTAVEDRLHQPFRASLVPGIKKVLAAAKLAGARGVALSGAGPAVIAFVDSNFDLIAQVMGDTFRQNSVLCKTAILKPSPVGARALEIR